MRQIGEWRLTQMTYRAAGSMKWGMPLMQDNHRLLQMNDHWRFVRTYGYIPTHPKGNPHLPLLLGCVYCWVNHTLSIDHPVLIHEISSLVGHAPWITHDSWGFSTVLGGLPPDVVDISGHDPYLPSNSYIAYFHPEVFWNFSQPKNGPSIYTKQWCGGAPILGNLHP